VLALDEPFAALDAITRLQMQGWLGHVLESEPRTVVLVTHDVEEAIVLADRLVVMSPRPGRAVAELEIELGRPRRPTDPTVVGYRERALEALGTSR
jgi:NitT/TauT family transport system ATP-binding protein